MQKGKQGTRSAVLQLQLSPTSSDESSAELRMERLLSESPVMIIARSSTSSSTRCMCHVMKNLLTTIGVHPTLVQLEDDEMKALPDQAEAEEEVVMSGCGGGGPAVFIGGRRVGGLERLVALHLSGQLVPKLVEVGALNQKDAVVVSHVFGVA